MKYTLNLRPAKESDTDIVLSWRNELETISNMKTKRALSLEEHTPWFMKAISDTDCLFLIIEIDGNPIGQIRYNLEDKMAKVSINITSALHGKGIASKAFSKGSKYVKETSFAEAIFARVLTSNIGSIKGMERAGFRVIREFIYDDAPHFYMTHDLKGI